VNSADLQKLEIFPTREEHLGAIRELAAVIWRAHYPGIISPEQIEYMLERMYSLDTLRNEVRSQGIQYDRLFLDGELIGFASYGATLESRVMKLHKLYLLPIMHGRGFGSLLLRHCEREARKRGMRRLVLTVNKQNYKAIKAYQRNGMRIADSVVTDIGGGYVMDDFVMEKELGG
jgi:GNAT superfamily N-acetyltransferase